MYSCSNCGNDLAADGLCPACGTAHSLPEPVAQPTQPTQDFYAQPGQEFQQPYGGQTAGFGESAQSAQSPEPTGLTGGNGLVQFENGDAVVSLNGGAKKVKVFVIVGAIASLLMIAFILPWYTLEAEYWIKMSFYSDSDTLRETGNGFEFVFGDSSSGLFHLLLFVIPAFIGAIVSGKIEAIQEKANAFAEKIWLVLAGGFGLGLILQCVLHSAISSEVRAILGDAISAFEALVEIAGKDAGGVSASVSPSIGWFLAIILNIVGAGICAYCYMQQKKIQEEVNRR
ncbi:MAG: hypothetical protein FWG83_00850 [Oscillospiraceae bacterium]|nr:hypothetical protein [Oscillospiraceae bacterium]